MQYFISLSAPAPRLAPLRRKIILYKCINRRKLYKMQAYIWYEMLWMLSSSPPDHLSRETFSFRFSFSYSFRYFVRNCSIWTHLKDSSSTIVGLCGSQLVGVTWLCYYLYIAIFLYNVYIFFSFLLFYNSFTLYPTFKSTIRESLVLRHSVSPTPLNSRDIEMEN